MDLDLRLGLPRPSRPPSFGLGSDLALGSPAESREAAASDSAPPVFPHAPYCPSYVSSVSDPVDHSRPLSAIGDAAAPVLEYSPYSPSYQPLGPPYAPIPPPVPPGAFNPCRRGSLYPASAARLHPPYDPLPHLVCWPPSHVPLSMIPGDQGEAAYDRRRRFPLGSPDAASPMRGDGPSSQSSFLESEFHLGRLIALHRRPWEGGPFRDSNPFEDEGPTSTMDSSNRMVPESSDPEASMEICTKNEGGDEGVVDKSSKEAEEERRSESAVNFECNICLELAKEPVVTSCGHLFCWPCLYQWLNVHCSYNECPVCKGEVTRCGITPIYGRGGCISRLEEEGGGGDSSGMKIPPRPRGRRLESQRQKMQRPISRRFSGVEIDNSRTHLRGEEMNNRDIANGDGDQSLQQTMGVESTAVMGRRLARARGRTQHGFLTSRQYRNAALNRWNFVTANSMFQGASGEVRTRSSSNRLDRGGSLAGTAVGASGILARTNGSANFTGASAPSLSSQNPSGSVLVWPPTESSQVVGQASASSPTATRQEDAGTSDATGSTRHPIRARRRRLS